MSSLILVINGPTNSGKSTIARLVHNLMQQAGITVGSWRVSDELKRITHDFFGLTDTGTNHYEDAKDTACHDFYGMTPRQAYVWMSEEVIKPKFGNAHIAQRLIADLPKRNIEKVRIFECNFREEYDALMKTMPGRPIIIHTHSTHSTFEGDSRSYFDAPGVSVWDLNNDFDLKQPANAKNLRKLTEQCALMMLELSKSYGSFQLTHMFDYDRIVRLELAYQDARN